MPDNKNGRNARNHRKKPKRDLRLFFNDIREAIKDIQAHTTGMTYDDFLMDKKTFQAVWKCFEIIGEAVKNIPQEVKAIYPDTDWKAIAGMRDKLAHEYFGVSHSIIWATISEDRPSLEKAVRSYLDENK